MPVDVDSLSAVLDEANIDSCVQFFAKASDSERQAVAKHSEKRLRDLTRDEENPTRTWSELGARRETVARMAVFATCSFSTIKSLGWSIFPIGHEVVRVLSDRRPKWLDDLAEFLLDREGPAWPSVRLLIRAGLIAKPTHDNYVLGMTHHHAGVGGSATAPSELRGRTTTKWNILTHLEAEPDLIEDVWRLFEIEGHGEYSLAAHDKYTLPERRWDAALVELSKRGVMSRDRLLDASLNALDRGFAQFRAGWFSAFHEALKPTLEERVVRLNQYLTLLASPIPPTVSFALAAIEIIDKEQPLPGTTIVEASSPLMRATTKGTVKSGLKLLSRVAKKQPELSSVVARIAAEALIHEASDIQLAALKLIIASGSTSDTELVEAVTHAQSSIAASNRAMLNDWLASQASSDAEHAKGKTKTEKASSSIEVQTSETSSRTDSVLDLVEIKSLEERSKLIPEKWRILAGIDQSLIALKMGRLDFSSCQFDGTEFPRLSPEKAIHPVKSLEELIDLAAALVENGDNFDEIERLFDGISRLCDQRPSDFEKRTAPLVKRIRQLMKRHWIIPFTGDNPGADMLGVVLAWLTGDYGTYGPAKLEHGNMIIEYTFDGEKRSFRTTNLGSLTGAMSERARLLADRVAQRQAVATLCAPTHTGGWIDPLIAVERANCKQILDQMNDFEKVLFLLRLAPDHRSEAIKKLRVENGEFHAALRYALCGPDDQNLASTLKGLVNSDWLWVAAARARSPWKNDDLIEKHFPNLGPDAGMAAHTTFHAATETRTYAYGSFEAKTLTIHVSSGSHARTQNELKKPSSNSTQSQNEVSSSMIDLRLFTVLLWQPALQEKRIDFDCASLIRQLFNIWPIAKEAASSWGALVIGGNLDWLEARWQNRLYLEPLLDSDMPLRPMALLLLVLGLAAKDPGEQGLATDAAIAAIEDGRFDPHQFGSVMAALLPTGYVKAARWAKTLKSVAQVSPLHEECIRASIENALRGDPKSMPKDFHSLIELFHELVVETKSPPGTTAVEFLKPLVGSSKLGKAAKAIVTAQFSAEPSRFLEIQRQIVESRMARAERWMKLASGDAHSAIENT